MPVNPYFNHFNHGRTQDLFEDLTIEAIRNFGQDVKYIPRTLVRNDELFGEDVLSKFDDAVDLEMYVKSVDGFGGEGDFLSKFGVEIRDTVTFTVARKRFEQARSEKLLSENGYNLVLESANTGSPSRKFIVDSDGTYGAYRLESDEYSIDRERPMEGDLIYFPMVKKLFEIKYVEHEELFYQAGRLRTYELRCELFEYSSQRLETGNTEIDAIETAFSTDVVGFGFELEDESGVLLSEDSGKVLQEYRVESTQPTANNEFFRVQGLDVIDFSEENPFRVS